LQPARLKQQLLQQYNNNLMEKGEKE